MFKKKLVLIIAIFITLLFFNKFIFKGLTYFPGDLLINNYSPWKYYSYLGYNPGSYPSKFQYVDVARQLYPWKIYSIDSLKSGKVPLWNPFSFSGTPLLANLQSQVLTPLNLLYFVFGNIPAWNLSLMAQVLLAFFFTYLYARKLKLSEEASIFSGIAYSCSLYMATFFEYGVFGQTIMWLPLILYGVEDVVESATFKSFIILALSIAFCCFGGHLQLFTYVLGFAFLYGFIRIISLKKKMISASINLLIPFVLSIGIAAVQLLPTIELVGLSARAPHNTTFFFSYLMLKVNELITIVSPDIFGNPTTGNYLLSKSYPQTALYIGILPLIFALTAFVIKKNWSTKFYIFASIATLLLIVDNPLSRIFYSLPIPFLSSSAPTNGIFLLSFSLSILAGFGLENFIENKNKKSIYIAAIIGTVLVLSILLFKTLHIEFNTKNTLLTVGVIAISFIILLASNFIKQRKVIVILILIISVVDLFYYFQKFNPAVPSSIIYPKAEILSVIKNTAGTNRVWGYKAANIESNFSVATNYYSGEGYDPLYNRQYGKLIYSNDNKLLSTFSDQTRSDAAFLSTENLVSGNQLKVLNVIGTKFILDRVENGSTEKAYPADVFKPIYDKNGWKVFENKNAVPRAFLTSDFKMYKNDADFASKFFDNKFNPNVSTLISENPGIDASKNVSNGDLVIIKSYKANSVAMDIKANSKKLLFLSDSYYPGWKVYVDGVESKIYQADYAFRAVVVPQGSHKIRFVYIPESFNLGLKTSVISLFVLVVLSSIIYIRRNEKH